MKGLYLSSEIAAYLTEGKLILLPLGFQLSDIGATYAVLTDQALLGTIVLAQPFALKQDQLDVLLEATGLPKETAEGLFRAQETVFLYPIRELALFPSPIPYDVPPSAPPLLPDVVLPEGIQAEPLEKLHPSKKDIERDIKEGRVPQLLALLRYLGNSAYPRLKRGEPWGDWTLEKVLETFGRIVHRLWQLNPGYLQPPPEGDPRWNLSYWRCFQEALEHGYIQKAAPSILSQLEDLPDEFVIVPEWLSVTGSLVYGKHEPNDVDIVLRTEVPPGAWLKVVRTFQDKFSKPVHGTIEPTGPNWPYVPVYDLVARKRPKLELRTMHEPSFEPFYKQDALADPKKLKPGLPFVHYGVAGEFYLPEDVNDAWLHWGSRLVQKGDVIVVQPKHDGFRLHVSFSKGKLHVFGERVEVGRNFPDLPALLRKAGLEDVVLDCEFVEFTDTTWKAPVSRTQMAWFVGKEPQDRPVTIFVHDVMWYDGENVTQLPYVERLALLEEALPKAITYRNLRILRTPSKVVKTRREFLEAVAWASQAEEYASEGAMAKAGSFRYDPQEAKGLVVKLKNQIEIDALIIGYRRVFAPKPQGEKWTRQEALRKVPELLERSNTYQLRVALLDEESGLYVPLQAQKRLTAKDLTLDYDEEKQTWIGLDSPEVWEMFFGLPHPKAGQLAYSNTYNIKLDKPPEPGDILTVAPMELTPFQSEDGWHLSWQHPIAKNLKAKGAPVGTVQAALLAHRLNPDQFKPWATLLKVRL